MPPKKKEEEEVKIEFGRPGNTLKMGIVGLPNVGKSTMFNLLSKQSVPALNVPFCTIDPNLAKVSVPDVRFTKLCQIFKPKSEVPAGLQILDIAGLVPGASHGEGLGNAFLSHIREVDGIYHVVRAFDDVEIIHTEYDIDPIRDLKIIHQELALKDLEYVTKRIEDLTKIVSRQNDHNSKQEKELLIKVQETLQKDLWVRQGQWTGREIETLNSHLFLTAKPVVYLVNLSENDYLNKKNKWLKKIQDWVKANNDGIIIPFSAVYEQRIEAELSKQEEKKEQDKSPDQPLVNTQLNRIIRAGFKTLNLINFFTCGEDEVRCWTVRTNTLAPQAAGVIHTDFEKGFICAEVSKYDEFIEVKSESILKEQGKVLQRGKNYVVQDGDIIFFKFNVSKGGKKDK